MSSVRNRSPNLGFSFLNSSCLSLLALSLLAAPLKALEAKTPDFENITIELNDAADVMQTFQEVKWAAEKWIGCGLVCIRRD